VLAALVGTGWRRIPGKAGQRCARARAGDWGRNRPIDDQWALSGAQVQVANRFGPS
jgi:hypothetical protein